MVTVEGGGGLEPGCWDGFRSVSVLLSSLVEVFNCLLKTYFTSTAFLSRTCLCLDIVRAPWS
jgi:hypothetical protein